jgi:trehalose 2-sulfotransferase
MTPASYIICATPRSGSTLLCDLLAATGIAGKPASYFRRQSLPRWTERLSVAPGDDRAYLDAVLREGRGATGIFGLRLMWSTLPELTARLAPLYPATPDDLARLNAAFGPTAFIHLSRGDKVAQAVSQVKALQTGLWHLGADGTERERNAPESKPGYDPALIRQFVDELEGDEQSWSRWFAAYAVTPLELDYDALSADPAATLARVLTHLQLAPAAAASATPRTARLRDAQSEDWIARFKAETP